MLGLLVDGTGWALQEEETYAGSDSNKTGQWYGYVLPWVLSLSSTF